MIRFCRIFLRTIRIAWVLARHDTGFVLTALGFPMAVVRFFGIFASRNISGRDGERLGMAMVALGPSFIKLGQLLAMRADLIGDELARDLSYLHDQLPPFEVDLASIFEKSFGVSHLVVFKELNPIPVAAASIAQVYFAITHDDQKVAVKILRPGIHEQFTRDLDLVQWIAERVDRHRPDLNHFQLRRFVRVFRETVEREMNLCLEAAAAEELGENFKDCVFYRTPRIYWDYTRTNILTMEQIDGIPIGNVSALKQAGHSLDQVLAHSVETFFDQVFRDGFFHADIHGGNAFVEPNGTIVPVDFGIMGRLEERHRMFLAELLRGFVKQDYQGIASAYAANGYLPKDVSVLQFAQACRSVIAPISGKPTKEMSLGNLLGQLFYLARKFRINTDPDLLLLQKTMIMAEGMGQKLNPEINMWEITAPLMERWVRRKAWTKKPKYWMRTTLQTFDKLPRVVDHLEQFLALQTSEQATGLGSTKKKMPSQKSWRKMDVFFMAILAAIIMKVFFT